jgi:hypothetical protein
MTSRADYRFAQSLESHTTAFHTASNESEIKVSEIRIALREIYDGLPNEPTNMGIDSTRDINISKEYLFFTKAKEVLSQYDIDEYNILTFITTINEHQDLIISLQLLYPTPNNSNNNGNNSYNFFNITRWQVVQTGEWVPDNSLNLL